MSAIFISYTGRDPVGDAWADRLEQWFEDWGYGFFRDKSHSHGAKAGDDWRATLHRELRLATVMVSLCTKQYDSSPWCVGEVAIAVHRGLMVIPIQLVETAEDLKTIPLPLLLDINQAIKVTGASAPTEATLADVQRRLQRKLTEAMNWRALLSWQGHWQPYPGLLSFEDHQAPVFFGRDEAITSISKTLGSLLLQAPALLLLLGASGYGKSSLVKAGVVPKLRAERQPQAGGGEQPSWLVLPPFKPEAAPFAALQAVLAAAGCPGDGSDPLRQLQWLSSARQRPVLLVIDQFEELLTTAAGPDGEPGEGGRFLSFLEALLQGPPARVLVVGTMRTDFLAPLQSVSSTLTNKAIKETLEPIAPADFGQLITGPAHRAGLTLQPGLEERLVKDSGGGDALPLLAFTLLQLWEKRQERGCPVAGERGELWDLTVADYVHLVGGIDGSVRTQAKACWDPANSEPAEAKAMREAFLDHLVIVSDDGRVAKCTARRNDLPPDSWPILQQMVNKRLLVSSTVTEQGTKTVETILEIAHEALLNTWEPLVQWIEESREELRQGLGLQRQRVKRLTPDLAVVAPQRQRRQALEQLATLAAAGGIEQKAVGKEGREPLAELLIPPRVEGKTPPTAPIDDRADAALILALIGAEEPLSACLADGAAPVELRRRAAESLGLLAKRSSDPEQRERIERQLEAVLRGAPLDVRIEVELDLKQLDPAMLQGLVEQTQQQVAEALQQALQSGQLPPGLSEEQLRSIFEQAVQQQVQERLKGLQSELWAKGDAPGWKEHDERLPQLQGAAQGLQLAASAELPLLGSGPGRVVPMLTLTALEAGGGLQITTKVVEVPVWRLPLPEGEQLELVMVPGGEHRIGSPADERDKEAVLDWFAANRDGCRDLQTRKPVDVEVERRVELAPFWLLRHPISQRQWQAVVKAVEAVERELEESPAGAKAESLWDLHGQPGGLAVNQVSWFDCQEWLRRLNRWLGAQWVDLDGVGEPPQLVLPGDGQWEAACRAGTATPFHFGDTLDARWARYDASYVFGLGRKGPKLKQPGLNGGCALVNRYGLAEMHGQLYEWCADSWHPNPVGEGWHADGLPWEGEDGDLARRESGQRGWKLLRGGSWINLPHDCRAAGRNSVIPVTGVTSFGLRPCCCPSPPGSLLGS
jgi:formylglycine-generating enzyme required for sulfatase activity